MDGQQVAPKDAAVVEGLVGHGEEVRGGRVADQVAVGVQGVFSVFLRREGDTGGDLVREQGQGAGCEGVPGATSAWPPGFLPRMASRRTMTEMASTSTAMVIPHKLHLAGKHGAIPRACR